MKTEHTEALNSLPRLADGSLAYPGRKVWREYLGERWEAEVVSVGGGRAGATMDLVYTNSANHRAKGCRSRMNDPRAWQPIEPEEQSRPTEEQSHPTEEQSHPTEEQSRPTEEQSHPTTVLNDQHGGSGGLLATVGDLRVLLSDLPGDCPLIGTWETTLQPVYAYLSDHGVFVIDLDAACYQDEITREATVERWNEEVGLGDPVPTPGSGGRWTHDPDLKIKILGRYLEERYGQSALAVCADRLLASERLRAQCERKLSLIQGHVEMVVGCFSMNFKELREVEAPVLLEKWDEAVRACEVVLEKEIASLFTPDKEATP